MTSNFEPYYAVIFTSKRTEGDNGYAEMSQLMDSLVKKQKGFIGVDNNENMDEIFSEELSRYPDTFFPLCCDISIENDVRKYMNLARSTFGRIKIMINNGIPVFPSTDRTFVS